jgi:predicted transcriptional regulator
MAPRKQTRLVQVKLRISDDLKRRLDREAKKRVDGSLSAEIAERLEQSFKRPVQEEAIATAVAEKLIVAGWPPSTGS